ncbi:MAG: hypothetical protein ABIP27_12180 [Flavobacterium circumlabens]|uniref:hypothetical protein n=1 Tax=Flavobacterium circumlabens TaxID=2133765 RepID=UPI0032667C63
MNDTSKLIEHFYAEALKHDIDSEEFSKNASKISAFYKDVFSADKLYRTYIDFFYKHNSDKTLELLSEMKLELIKFHKS